MRSARQANMAYDMAIHGGRDPRDYPETRRTPLPYNPDNWETLATVCLKDGEIVIIPVDNNEDKELPETL